MAATLLVLPLVCDLAEGVTGCAAEQPARPRASLPENTQADDARSEPPPRPGMVQAGYATYYARRFAGRKTASGDRYDPALMTAAHRTLPLGTVVEVRRPDGRSVVVRINDRGPYGHEGRIIDLSRRAAEELGMVADGKARVEVRVLAVP